MSDNAKKANEREYEETLMLNAFLSKKNTEAVKERRIDIIRRGRMFLISHFQMNGFILRRNNIGPIVLKQYYFECNLLRTDEP